MIQGSKAAHLNWLVESRNTIQVLMLEVLHLLEDRERESDHPNRSRLAVSHLMVAAVYSLWRAVFLGNVLLTEDATAASAKKFLITLIEDNAIGYYQELANREWTFGYYTNNARLRVGEIALRSPVFKDVLEQSGCTDMSWVIAVGKAPEDLWADTFKGLELAVKNSTVIFESILST